MSSGADVSDVCRVNFRANKVYEETAADFLAGLGTVEEGICTTGPVLPTKKFIDNSGSCR